MSGRFQIDLLHPGRVAQTWQEPFTGSQGRRNLALATLGGAGVLLVFLLTFILPAYWRLSADLDAVPRLQRDLNAIEGDLNTLRTNLRALTNEARRQVRWADLLGTLAQQTPPTIRLQVVETAHVGPPPPAPGQPATGRGETVLRVEAVTPARPGSPPMIEIAQFMAGLMRDPAVNRRFQLKTWEVKPPVTATGPDTAGLLGLVIVLSERQG